MTSGAFLLGRGTGIQGMFAEFCGMGDQPLVLGIRSNSHVNLDVDHIECMQNSFLTQGGYDAGLGCCSRSPHKDHLRGRAGRAEVGVASA